MHDVGDTPTVYLRVRNPDTRALVDADLTPTATLTDPDGATTALVVAHPEVGVYRVAPALVAAGEWTVTWTATISAAVQTEAHTLLAVVPGEDGWEAPVWTPTLADVADHIPTRTRPTAEWAGSDAMLGTFTAATTPTDEQAARLIRRATAWVEGVIGAPVAATVRQLASAAAALRAAYWVELAYPERDADVAVYDRLREEAAAALLSATAQNAAAGAVAPTPPGVPDDLVSFSFPDAPRWADRAFL